MDASRRSEPLDPDFDALPTHPRRRSLGEFDPVEHQRLIVNPFLGVLGLVGLAWLARTLARSPYPGLVAFVLIPLVFLTYLIQYHCLDCGRTGLYQGHQAHACPGALARAREDRRWRFPFPTPWAQLVVWGWVLAGLAILLAVWAWT